MKISKKQQIQIIKAKVEDLTDALENLNLELGILEQSFETTVPPTVTPPIRPFQKGDILQITNTYLGKKGTIGEVKSTSKIYCTILDSSGAFHTRSRANFSLYRPCPPSTSL